MGKVARQEKIRLFAEEVYAAAKLGMWCFENHSQKLFSTTLPNKEEIFSLLKNNVELDIFNNAEGFKRPIILTDSNGLFWIAEHFYYIKDKPALFFLMGPIFANTQSFKVLDKKIDKMNLTFEQRRAMKAAVSQIPIMHISMINQYSVMFHYSLTEEGIQFSDLSFPSLSDDYDYFYDNNQYTRDFEELYQLEELLLKAVREGNLNYKNVIKNLGHLTSEFDVDSDNILQEAKNSLIALCALGTKETIHGGVPIQNAKFTEFIYRKSISECKTVSEVVELREKMVDDFVKKVYNIRRLENISTFAQNIINDISSNLYNNISIKGLAQKFNYSEYYLSQKFFNETGIRLVDYIKYAKIQQAKLLLESSKKSIQEISDLLNFSSRNYFSVVFKDIVGESPAAYRASSNKFD